MYIIKAKELAEKHPHMTVWFKEIKDDCFWLNECQIEDDEELKLTYSGYAGRDDDGFSLYVIEFKDKRENIVKHVTYNFENHLEACNKIGIENIFNEVGE